MIKMETTFASTRAPRGARIGTQSWNYTRKRDASLDKYQVSNQKASFLQLSCEWETKQDLTVYRYLV